MNKIVLLFSTISVIFCPKESISAVKSILRSIYCGMAIGVPACRISTLKIMILFLQAPQLFIGSLIYESNLIVQDIGGIWNYLEPYYGRRSCDQLCRSSTLS